MAKKKGRRRRASLVTKAINVGVLALAFATPIRMILAGAKLEDIAGMATGDLSKGATFNKDLVIQFYGPMLAAIVLKKAISMVRKTVRI